MLRYFRKSEIIWPSAAGALLLLRSFLANSGVSGSVSGGVTDRSEKTYTDGHPSDLHCSPHHPRDLVVRH